MLFERGESAKRDEDENADMQGRRRSLQRFRRSVLRHRYTLVVEMLLNFFFPLSKLASHQWFSMLVCYIRNCMCYIFYK